MRIDYTPEQRALAAELREYFAELMTPERRAGLRSGGGEYGAAGGGCQDQQEDASRGEARSDGQKPFPARGARNRVAVNCPRLRHESPAQVAKNDR